LTVPGADVDPCPVSEEELAALSGGAAPPYDLGDAPTASFEHTFDPDLLAAACDAAAAASDPPAIDCAGGFPVRVRLEVTAGGLTRIAVRDLRLRFLPEHEANANPAIDGVSVALGDDLVPLDDAGGVALRRREERDLV